MIRVLLQPICEYELSEVIDKDKENQKCPIIFIFYC